MATITTVEQAEAQPHVEAVAAQPQREAQRRSLWPSVDGNGMTLIAIATLAIASFTYLNIRIDNVGTEMRTRFERVDDRFDKVNERFNKVNEKIDRTNERIDRLTEKISELLIEQRRGR